MTSVIEQKRVLQKDPYVQDGTQDVFYNIDTL